MPIFEYDHIIIELKEVIGIIKRSVKRPLDNMKDLILYNRIIILSNMIDIDELVRIFKRELGTNYHILEESVRRGYECRKQEYKSFQTVELF